MYETTNNVKKHIRKNFPYRCSLAVEQLSEEIENRKLFGYVQFDIELPEKLKTKFANLPPISQNTLLSHNGKNYLLKAYAEEEGKICLLRKMFFEIHVKEWYIDNSSSFVLSCISPCLYKIPPFS